MKSFLAAATVTLTLNAGAASGAIVSVTNTHGDNDCFGLGGICADGDEFVDGLGGTFFADNRSPADLANAPGTDIWDTGNLSWTHTYALPGTPLVATLSLLIAGFADIGPSELRVDGVPVATFDFPLQFQAVHAISVAVPLSAIDGSTTFSIVGDDDDGYIIDASTLTFRAEVADVLSPATSVLLGAGLAGLAAARRRRA